MTEKRKEEVWHAKLPAERKRPEQEWSEPAFSLAEQERPSRGAARNGQGELIERQLPEPEIQRLQAEQERLRIEAERVWLEQERHFAEQARLRTETESIDRDRYEAEIQQLIAPQPRFETEERLSEKENFDEPEGAAATRFSEDSTQTRHSAGIFLDAPRQSVSSGVLSKETSKETSEETTDFSLAYSQNRKISWLLPGAALIFLMFGGAVLGGWYLQTSKTEESNQTNPGRTESKQTKPNQTVSSSFVSRPEPAAESTPEMNKVPPTALPTPPATRPVGKRSFAAKPTAPPVAKPTSQTRKTPPKPKQPVTIDDILNDR